MKNIINIIQNKYLFRILAKTNKLIYSKKAKEYKQKKKVLLARFFGAIGDNLIMSAVVRELYKQKYEITLITPYPELFTNNHKIKKVINFNELNLFKKAKYYFMTYYSEFDNIVFFKYTNKHNLKESHDDVLKKTKTKKHLIEATMMHKKKLSEKIKTKNYKNEIFLSKEEIKKYEQKFKTIKKPYGLITSGLNKVMITKDWKIEGMQAIVKSVKKINWVQIGAKDEKNILKNTTNMIGKTTLRELTYLFKDAKIAVTTEGLNTHLSSIYETPCITIFTGFNYPEISSYTNIIPIQQQNLPACAPCWNALKCKKYPEAICAKDIDVHEIIKKIKKITKE